MDIRSNPPDTGKATTKGSLVGLLSGKAQAAKDRPGCCKNSKLIAWPAGPQFLKTKPSQYGVVRAPPRADRWACLDDKSPERVSPLPTSDCTGAKQ